MDSISFVAIVFKFALYSSVLFATGTVFYTVLFEKAEARRYFTAQKVIGLLTIVALLSTFIVYALRAASLTGEWGSMVEREMLAILWQTPVGTALLFRVVGLALILLGLLAGGLSKTVLLIASIVVLVSFSQIGHVTTISDLSFLPTVLLFVHLVGIALWVGILFPLYRLSNHSKLITTTATIAHQFGRLAMFFVPILLIAGAWLAYLLVGSLDKLLYSRYGQVLLFKLVLVTGLLGFAATNKLRFVPELKAGELTSLKRLRVSVGMEMVLILAILIATGILTSVLTLP